MNIELDKVIHQPIRTKIISYLVINNEADYTFIKKEFDLSDGHMTTHMKEFIEYEYVIFRKEFVNNKSKTTYIITEKGRNAFLNYINSLKKIINME